MCVHMYMHMHMYIHVHVQVAIDAVTHTVDGMTAFAESTFFWFTLVTDD